jgi:hypothetical protein
LYVIEARLLSHLERHAHPSFLFSFFFGDTVASDVIVSDVFYAVIQLKRYLYFSIARKSQETKIAFDFQLGFGDAIRFVSRIVHMLHSRLNRCFRATITQSEL